MNKEQLIKDAFAETKLCCEDVPKTFLDKVIVKIIEKSYHEGKKEGIAEEKQRLCKKFHQLLVQQLTLNEFLDEIEKELKN